MSTLLTLLCLMCIISGINSLRFSLNRNVSTLTGSKPVCGVLTCKESSPNRIESTITRMSVFKMTESGSVSSVKPDRSNLMASITLREPFITRESESVKINGSLEDGRASLRLELVTKEDCSAEYTCEVRMLDSRERESINTYHLLQHHDHSANQEGGSTTATSAGSLPVLLLLQQLDTKLAMMDSKVSSAENRLEDKISSLYDDMESKIEKRIMDKLHQMDNTLSSVDDAVNAKQEGLEDLEESLAILREELKTGHAETHTNTPAVSETCDDRLNSTSKTISSVHKLLTEFLAWQQTDQFNCNNLSQVTQQVLNSNEDLSNDVNQHFSQLHNFLEDFKQLETDIKNISSINSAGSIHEIFRPKVCRKGMISVLPDSPFPYPVIRPNLEASFTFPYLCDITTDGGGWIVIQRRTTGNVDFYRDWATYKKGFGSLDDDFWLGNDNIHAITSSGTYELRVDLKYKAKSAFAHYSTVFIDDEDNNYAIKLGDYDGTAGDDLDHHRGQPFSTFDRDNDAHSSLNCAVSYSGAWWYKSCQSSNLNGKWMVGSSKGARWYGFSGSNPVFYSEMKIRKL
ncbi:tenascin-r [Plakobranchus ocellatus]|uniref:Tenascin-r n=1 Tax=Plakobranchus ocellatus TaxID=259542 RepID=A0AAV4CHM6_9GAST|nr:tenascin-r [Plakobranchus ocellatus]